MSKEAGQKEGKNNFKRWGKISIHIFFYVFYSFLTQFSCFALTYTRKSKAEKHKNCNVCINVQFFVFMLFYVLHFYIFSLIFYTYIDITRSLSLTKYMQRSLCFPKENIFHNSTFINLSFLSYFALSYITIVCCKNHAL